ncbi:uncharacterized protein LOC112559066, partial [Pomacea canaliculata]|uniref:uncharacterized protein LOC112559066 n=1 Tax=Pomacea canaliculata TaxID=400727 RepID=UPI000D72A14F
YPVHVALNEDNWDVVKAFVEHGADPNILDRKGQCLLHKFVRNLNQKNSVPLVKALVKHGAEINWRGPNGKTALQLAASNSEWEMVVALVELGADCILTPKEKLSVFENLHCLTWRDEKKLKVFINYITKNVSESDENNRFKKIYRRYQNPLLKKSVKKCNWMMAKALVECGAKVSLILENKALLQLIMSKSSISKHTPWTQFFDLLISKGLDINTRLENQSPVLFSDEVIVSLIHEEDVSRCLFCAWVKRGANPLIPNCDGFTPLNIVMNLYRHGARNALIKLLPMGVTTHQPKFTEAILQSKRFTSNYVASPTESAIHDYNICALKMLIGSGASSNAELFRLNTKYQVKLAEQADENEDVRELLEVLDQAASQPPSLTSLCRLTVSHLLGCGPCRPDKIKHLKIPSSLKSLISFSDLLLPEFLSQKHEDVHSGLSEDSNDFSSNSDY